MLSGLLLALVGLASPGQALPPQGIYEGCPPREERCLRRLDEMASAGFQLALNYRQWRGTAEDLRRYADHAEARGMQVIWPLSDEVWRDGSDLRREHPQLARGCRCRDRDGFVRFAIDLVKDHPATWGYYVGDEVRPADEPDVARLADEVRRLDPRHPRLYVARENAKTGGRNLRPFARDAEFVGADSYPVGRGQPLSTVARVAETVASIARRARRRSALVLQAFSWDQYEPGRHPGARFPSASEMRRMRDLALEAGDPDLILWYSLQDVKRSPAPGRHRRDLESAARAPHPRDDRAPLHRLFRALAERLIAGPVPRDAAGPDNTGRRSAGGGDPAAPALL